MLAPARTYAPSLEYLLAAHELGYFRAGTEGTVLIASGSDWWEAAEARCSLALLRRREPGGKDSSGGGGAGEARALASLRPGTLQNPVNPYP